MLRFRLKDRLKSIRTFGFDVEHYPHYVNRQKRLHGLDVVLLSCVLRGRGQHIIGDQTFDEVGPSVAVTHYGQLHDIVTDEAGIDVINVYLDLQNFPLPTLPAELQPILPLWLPLHAAFKHRLNRIVRLPMPDVEPMATLLTGIMRELKDRPPGFAEMVAMQFKQFLILCCRQAMSRVLIQPKLGESGLDRLENLRAYLDQNYADEHTLQSLARRAGLSRTYLCRAFRRYTGKRVFDYLIDRRIQGAMLRLQNRDEKILSIALDCGFNNLPYFNRRFKERIGQTPSEYRKSMTG